jgi:hypothetical protein
MVTKLAPLDSRLSALRRHRWTVRVARGGMELALSLLAAIAVDCLLDWLFSFGRTQRGFLLIVLSLVALWGLRRFVWPALVARETNIDLALLVERQHGIDSDLVAALQFDSREADEWGSRQLESAVVDRVAGLGNRLDVGQGLSIDRVRFLGSVLATSAFVLAVAALLFPTHAAAFVNRLLLGSAHYPTRTQIVRITINAAPVDPGAAALPAPRIPFGGAVRFDVESAGISPDSGSVRVVAPGGGAAAVALVPSQAAGGSREATEPAVGHSNRVGYAGELPRLMENVSYQVFLGDAWTEPAPLEIIPPPVVALELDHTPPPYVAGGASSLRSTNSRQLSVVEGSHVWLTVRCGNKRLLKAELVTEGARFPLEPQDAERHVWKIPETGTPLARVIAPVPFEVDVVDIDGISPEAPLRGHIRIEADRPPRIAAAVVTEKVLPAARPGITWGAADDYGLAEIRIHKQMIHSSGKIEQTVDVVRRIPDQSQPQKALRGRLELDLAPFGLAKGDQVRVTLEAVDYRGDHPGTPVQSEPVVFQVTDESGILAGLVEADEKSARQLDEIIQRQLGAGENSK